MVISLIAAAGLMTAAGALQSRGRLRRAGLLSGACSLSLAATLLWGGWEAYPGLLVLLVAAPVLQYRYAVSPQPPQGVSSR